MTDWIKKALTKKITIKTTEKRKPKIIEVEPSERLVYGVKFSIAITLSLTLLQIAHMAFLGRWNSEIFSAITAPNRNNHRHNNQPEGINHERTTSSIYK